MSFSNVRALLCALFLGATMGCSAPSPLGPTGQDAGPTADTQPDVQAADRETAADTAPDASIPPEDRPTPTDTPATETGPADAATEVCRATFEPPARDCAGSALCQPNFVNPTCAGALACTCGFSETDMPPSLCTPTLMPTCMEMVSCAPGRNHCSIHLPEGVDYAPFPSLEPVAGHGGLRQTVMAGWISEDRTVQDHFLSQSIFDGRGFVQVCFSLPESPAVPAAMRGRTACAACSGSTCYWNRGRIRATAPSVEIRFADGACGYEWRLYAAGTQSPIETIPMVSLSNACN